MKVISIILTFALICSLVHSGTLLLGNNNPILTVRQTTEVNGVSAQGQIPVVFRFGEITVPRSQWLIGLHGIAYKQLTYLYPLYNNYGIQNCAYTIYGPSRIYTFSLSDEKNHTVKLFSSVQNNQQDSGQSTQQTVQQQAKAKIQAQQVNSLNVVSQSNSGYRIIKLSRAYQIPRTALAIKYVIRNNWSVIQSSPLTQCLQKWENGLYNFRFYFNGINQPFEYSHFSDYQSNEAQLETSNTTNSSPKPSNLRTDSPIVNSSKPSVDSSYLPRQQPIFTVTQVNGYNPFTLNDLRKNPGYPQIIQACNDHFGRFDESWLNKIQYRLDNDVHYFQFQVGFIPFLINIDFEAHYYGSTQKASLLQIDEQVFNGADNQKYFNSWSEIKNFDSYQTFKDTNQYVLSQFTYLRFYQVKAAYSALYKNGRYVRLVYESTNNSFSPYGENQFNMVVYICDGQFYIDRDDFLSTGTNSYGKNDWVSLFVKVSDVNTNQDFDRIVKYFKVNHADFWYTKTVEEVRFKNNLYVVKFRNPSKNVTDDLFNLCVIDLSNNSVKILNHFDWTIVDSSSIQYSKAIDFIKHKYNVSAPLFAHHQITAYGNHFEISYLNDKSIFSNAYLRFIADETLFTEDEWQGIAYDINFDGFPLPLDPISNIINFISKDTSIIIIAEVKNVTKNIYSCIASTKSQRWKITINWIQGNWVINNKQLILDGYYFLNGYPSVNVASCTGFLARLYSTLFTSKWIYSTIEVKNIGYFIYTRVIYKLGSVGYQGIVRTTYGVENSQTLISWDLLPFLRFSDDYGFGVNYNWNYGYNSNYFFNYSIQVNTTIIIDSGKTTKNSNDILCSFWDNGKCLACLGDYYSDYTGTCVRIQDECEYWQVGNNCARCSYGYKVDLFGKCVRF